MNVTLFSFYLLNPLQMSGRLDVLLVILRKHHYYCYIMTIEILNIFISRAWKVNLKPAES